MKTLLLTKEGKRIQKSTVAETITSYKPNRVLRLHLPAIDQSEKELLRTARTNLAQLRSGFCNMLDARNNLLRKEGMSLQIATSTCIVKGWTARKQLYIWNELTR